MTGRVPGRRVKGLQSEVDREAVQGFVDPIRQGHSFSDRSRGIPRVLEVIAFRRGPETERLERFGNLGVGGSLAIEVEEKAGPHRITLDRGGSYTRRMAGRPRSRSPWAAGNHRTRLDRGGTDLW